MNDPEPASIHPGPAARLRQARAIMALALTLLLALPWACLPRGPLRTALARLGWSILLAGFGVRLRRHGHPTPTRTLVVANHVSWIDIAALARLLDCGFIAKSEIAAWPVIGALARRQGCLFVDRSRRGGVQSVLADMHGYRRRQILALFPEGTSGEGDRVLPFRSSLFAAAGNRFETVQPVTLHYRRADGRRLEPAERQAIAWVGEAALLPHAMALAASGGAVLDLWFEAPVPAADRKTMAEACHAAIAARLTELEGSDQAAALKRAA